MTATEKGAGEVNVHDNSTIAYRERVVTKAVVKAAELLKLSEPEFAGLIGVSETTVAKLKAVESVIREKSAEQQLVVYLIGIFESLSALYGNNEDHMAEWLRAENKVFNKAPIREMATMSGMANTARHLDQYRFRV